MHISEIYKIYKECGGRVTTDTRTLTGGELFFALKGENFDGNEYALKALEAGAAYAVVNAGSRVAGDLSAGRLDEALVNAGGICRLIPVQDTLKTLQELARWHRSMTFVDGKPLTVIALTGTNGKTTTKELIRTVLSVKYRVTATEGNLNNNIGVPLTLLKINSLTQIAVVEMGASHPGDIKELVDIALPNFGLVTNVGKAHLLGFGSFEGVMRTKGELYDYLRRTSDKVFVNVDNPHLCRMAAERCLQSDPERPYSLVLPYGLEYSGASVLPASPQQPFLRISLPGEDGNSLEIRTNLVGAYNADNVMAALAVGKHFGVPVEDGVRAIEGYVSSNNRSQMKQTQRNTLIVDAYNANPTSMAAALDNFAAMCSPQPKILMIGDMLELGEDSLAEHKGVIERALKMDCEHIYLVGAEFGKAMDELRCSAPAKASDDSAWKKEAAGGLLRCFSTSADLAAYLSENSVSGRTVLVKGSRGTRMENVVPVL